MIRTRSPVDRFRFTSRILTTDEQPVTGKVWDLFTDKQALTSEMTSVVQGRLALKVKGETLETLRSY